MTVPAMSARRYPAPVDDETLHELFQAIEGIDTDHPDYAELFIEFAETYRADLEAEAGGK